jgi:hypothetical protein
MIIFASGGQKYEVQDMGIVDMLVSVDHFHGHLCLRGMERDEL